MKFINKWIANAREKKQARIDRINRWAFDDYAGYWLWSVTDPCKQGVQNTWTYKCAYCGKEVMGKDLKTDCQKCGAQLIEDPQ